MVVLFVGDDLRNCCRNSGIGLPQLGKLLMEVPQHDAFDGYRSGGDGLAAHQAGEQSKRQPA